MKDKKDSSPYVFQRKKISIDLKIKEIPFTPKQLDFINLALDKKTSMILVDAPAGVGKSLLAVYCVLKQMNEHRLSDLIYIRSTVQSKDGETGFLQGSLEEKLQYANVPLMDKLEELLPIEQVKALINDSRIHTIPTSLIRGNSHAAKGIIADECQNMLFESCVTIATRAGEYSKVFMIGDSQQNDFGAKSGFVKFYNLFNDQESRDNGVVCYKFDEGDILRSKLVKYIVTKINRAKSAEPMF